MLRCRALTRSPAESLCAQHCAWPLARKDIVPVPKDSTAITTRCLTGCNQLCAGPWEQIRGNRSNCRPSEQGHDSLLKKVVSELRPGSKLYYQRPLQPTLGSLQRQETHYLPRPGVAPQLGSPNGVSNRKHPFSPKSLQFCHSHHTEDNDQVIVSSHWPKSRGLTLCQLCPGKLPLPLSASPSPASQPQPASELSSLNATPPSLRPSPGWESLNK